MLDALLSWLIENIGAQFVLKWIERKKAKALLDHQKRRILETRISHVRWAELHQLRDLFLQFDLADKCVGNRKFFVKWLTNPVVEMGWSPGGGWTLNGISELHADLESVRTWVPPHRTGFAFPSAANGAV